MRTQNRPGPPGGPPPGNQNTNGDGSWRNRALLAGAFFLGLGAGVWFSEDVNLYPNNVASTELVDRRTPNSEVCMSNGYSAMVFDQRLFVSFNPCVTSSPTTHHSTESFLHNHAANMGAEAKRLSSLDLLTVMDLLALQA
jgi:hypothetical protein